LNIQSEFLKATEASVGQVLAGPVDAPAPPPPPPSSSSLSLNKNVEYSQPSLDNYEIDSAAGSDDAPTTPPNRNVK
jgi:hypothetical protein